MLEELDICDLSFKVLRVIYNVVRMSQNFYLDHFVMKNSSDLILQRRSFRNGEKGRSLLKISLLVGMLYVLHKVLTRFPSIAEC